MKDEESLVDLTDTEVCSFGFGAMTLEGSQTVAGYGAKRHTGFYPNLSSIDPGGIARKRV